MTITVNLMPNELAIVRNALIEKAMELEDDGREGCPVAALLWNVNKQMKVQGVA